MESEIVGLIGPGGKYVRVDPATKAVAFDSTSIGEHEKFEVTRFDDRRYQLRAIAGDVLLGADATRYSHNVCQQFFTMPAEVRGNYQLWEITQHESGLLEARVEYVYGQGSEDGRLHASAGLTVVRMAA